MSRRDDGTSVGLFDDILHPRPLTSSRMRVRPVTRRSAPPEDEVRQFDYVVRRCPRGHGTRVADFSEVWACETCLRVCYVEGPVAPFAYDVKTHNRLRRSMR